MKFLPVHYKWLKIKIRDFDYHCMCHTILRQKKCLFYYNKITFYYNRTRVIGKELRRDLKHKEQKINSYVKKQKIDFEIIFISYRHNNYEKYDEMRSVYASTHAWSRVETDLRRCYR